MGSRDLEVYRCERCRHAFIPARTHEQVLRFHDEQYRYKYWRDEIERRNNLAGIIDERFHQVRMGFVRARTQIVEPYLGREKLALDVGCGAGTFARHVRPMLRDVHGLELSRWFVDYMNRELHLKAWQCAVEDFQTDQRYDLIFSWHCLEHTADPRAFVRCCRELLADGGMLFLEVPIIEDWAHPPMGGFWNDSHAQYFTPQSLRRLLESYFEIFLERPGVQGPSWFVGCSPKSPHAEG